MFKMIDLKYDYNDLEPYIDEETMKLHYNKHYKTYTENLNDALKNLPHLQNKSIEYILSHLDDIDEKYRETIRNNGGGYYNHSVYFNNLTPNEISPKGDLLTKINEDFGSLDRLINKLKAAAMKVFGSGWAWLIFHQGKIKVVTSKNQDNSIMSNKGTPLLGLDVWEHAYYLKYKNLRKDYIDAFFYIIDWNDVNRRYTKARKNK